MPVDGEVAAALAAGELGSGQVPDVVGRVKAAKSRISASANGCPGPMVESVRQRFSNRQRPSSSVCRLGC